MGLRDWLKKGVLTIGLAGIIASGGCKTTYRTESKYSWEESDVKTRIEKKEERVLKYEIIEASFSQKQKELGSLSVKVIENLIKEQYENKITEKGYKMFTQDTEHRRYPDLLSARDGTKQALDFFLSPISIPLALLGISLVDEYRYDTKEGEPYLAGKTKVETSESGFKKVKDDIETKPASSILLKLRLLEQPSSLSEYGKNLEAITNEDGTKTIEIEFPRLEEYNIFFDKKGIKDKKWAGVKDPAEDFIEDYLVRNALKERATISIKTAVPEAKNGIKEVEAIDLWYIPDTILKNATEQFVKEKINSRIKDITMSLVDADSHTSIKDPTEGEIILKSIDVPTKRELIGEYFEGKLVNPALSALKDYIVGGSEISVDDDGNASFSVYLPSVFKAEIKHKKYYFVKGDRLGFNKNSLDKNVYMHKIGEKIDARAKEREPESKIKDKE